MSNIKYVTRTFPREILQLMLAEDLEDFEGLEMEVVDDEVYDNSRWSVHHRMIFKHGDKHYMVDYSRGATEQQDERPFEYSPVDVPCIEVEEKEVVIRQFLPIEQSNGG